MFYFIALVVEFAVRTVFIIVLGQQLLGLNSLLVTIVLFLNIAELGIGTAIGYSMYKPAAEGDIEKLKSLNSLFKRVYCVIALVVLAIGLAFIPLLQFFIESDVTYEVNIYIIYCLFLAGVVFSYFAAHKRTLLFVHQKQYVYTYVMIARIMLIALLKLVSLLVFENYYLFVAALSFGALFEAVVVLIITNKIYPEINGKGSPLDVETKGTIKKNVFALSLYRITNSAMSTIDALFLSFFFGLAVVGVFANYWLVISTVLILCMTISVAIQGSVGNMVASQDKESNYSAYKSLNLGFWLFSGFCAICLFVLLTPFISVWTSRLDGEWTFGKVIVLSLIIRFILDNTKQISSMYKEVTGLIPKLWWKAILEPAISIGLTFLFVHLWGISGIFFATALAILLTTFWIDPYVIHKYYFEKSIVGYMLKAIAFLAVTSIIGAAAYFATVALPAGVGFFFLKIVICVSMVLVGYFCFYFWTKDFKELVNSAKAVFQAIRRRKKTPQAEESLEVV